VAQRADVDDGPPLARLLPRAGQVLGRRLRQVVAPHGLTPTSLGVLGVLIADGPASHRELAAGLGVSPATLTPVVDALERAGSVIRARDGADRRVVHVSVSPEGRSRFADATAQVTRAFAEHLPQLPADHEAIVRAYLVSLLAALEPADHS
jgi:DNA-binding MarR family transcriptional regulator